MGAEIVFVIIALLSVASIVPGVILINKGKKLGITDDKGFKYIRAGWLILGIYFALITAGFVYLCIAVPFILVLLLIFIPIVVLIGLIISATCGIYYLVEGYKKEGRDPRKIKIGMTLLIINAAVLLTFGTLIILFMGGLIPIRLM